MPTLSEQIPSVPQFRPYLREKLCGTDGRGLKSPRPRTYPGEVGTNEYGRSGRIRTGIGRGVSNLCGPRQQVTAPSPVWTKKPPFGFHQMSGEWRA
jgi:hypothetical protein